MSTEPHNIPIEIIEEPDTPMPLLLSPLSECKQEGIEECPVVPMHFDIIESPTSELPTNFKLKVTVRDDSTKFIATADFLESIHDRSFQMDLEKTEVQDDFYIALKPQSCFFLIPSLREKLMMHGHDDAMQAKFSKTNGLLLTITVHRYTFKWVIRMNQFEQEMVIPKDKKKDIGFLAKTVVQLFNQVVKVEKDSEKSVIYAQSLKLEPNKPFVHSLMDFFDTQGAIKQSIGESIDSWHKSFIAALRLQITEGSTHTRRTLNTHSERHIPYTFSIPNNRVSITCNPTLFCRIERSSAVGDYFGMLRGEINIPKDLFINRSIENFVIPIAYVNTMQSVATPSFILQFSITENDKTHLFHLVSHFNIQNREMSLNVEKIFASNGPEKNETVQEIDRITVPDKIETNKIHLTCPISAAVVTRIELNKKYPYATFCCNMPLFIG